MNNLQAYEHTCRGQNACWCIGCVAYLYDHPRAKAHRFFEFWEVVKADGMWAIRTPHLHHAVEFASTYYPDGAVRGVLYGEVRIG